MTSATRCSGGGACMPVRMSAFGASAKAAPAAAKPSRPASRPVRNSDDLKRDMKASKSGSCGNDFAAGTLGLVGAAVRDRDHFAAPGRAQHLRQFGATDNLGL